MFRFSHIIRYVSLILLLLSALDAGAQNWMPGFRYRKKVTFDKSKVAAKQNEFNLINFPVLVQLEEADLKYVQDAFEQKLNHPKAYDISFATLTASTTALQFQIDHYDPLTGKLACWVLLPALVNQLSNDVATTIYFYYGGTTLHDPQSAAVQAFWNGRYAMVDHMSNAADGVIGGAATFNGSSDYILKDLVNSNTFVISAWIKLNSSDQEQVILSNENTGAWPYVFKVNDQSRLTFECAQPTGLWSLSSNQILIVNKWYYVSVSCLSTSINMLINGAPAASKTLNWSFGGRGRPFIGASTTGTHFFNGLMDEVRISTTVIENHWIATDYNMQYSPHTFIALGPEEVNPLIPSTVFTFLGVRNSTWSMSANWSNQRVPGNNENIRISAGKNPEVPAGLIINKLLLDEGAQLNVKAGVTIKGTLEIKPQASLSANTQAQLRLEGGVLNQGLVAFDTLGASITVAGTRTDLRWSGTGSIRTARLEIDLSATAASLQLGQAVKVSQSLRLLRGILKSDGFLQLSVANGKTAGVGPIVSPSAITGDVHVQHYLAGSFPAPSTGRGWRLLSAPVYQPGTSLQKQYQVQALQKSMFVTGPGGQANGFDPSGNNGATIYTHNQALPGSLTEKYVPLSTMQSQIAVGRGFFVFSRGDRHLPEAFLHQVQNRPFSNAAPYVLSYTGNLFSGDLTVEVFNVDQGGEGDGFNLLGNPYAADIRWGSLLKVNIGPNVWLFDPLNNTYRVSNDPEEIIPAGTGFFVRVLEGASTGTVGFTESCKVIL